MLFIALSICAGVSGQLVLKRGMSILGAQSLSASSVVDVLQRMAFSPWVIGGLLIYVAGTFFWLMVLSRVDLSYAYPMTSMSYILIVLSSWHFLGESISPLRIVGVLTIIVGVSASQLSLRADNREKACAQSSSAEVYWG
jgi:multidrug transporter EmrE-like cation transporter